MISSHELGVKHKHLFKISEHCQAAENKKLPFSGLEYIEQLEPKSNQLTGRGGKMYLAFPSSK